MIDDIKKKKDEFVKKRALSKEEQEKNLIQEQIAGVKDQIQKIQKKNPSENEDKVKNIFKDEAKKSRKPEEQKDMNKIVKQSYKQYVKEIKKCLESPNRGNESDNNEEEPLNADVSPKYPVEKEQN